jgi:hypothetical protein
VKQRQTKEEDKEYGEGDRKKEQRNKNEKDREQKDGILKKESGSTWQGRREERDKRIGKTKVADTSIFFAPKCKYTFYSEFNCSQIIIKQKNLV